MNVLGATSTSYAVARVQELLAGSLTSASDGVALHDQGLNAPASSCSASQAAGFYAMLQEPGITTSLLDQVARSQSDDGAFSIPYNQPITAPPKWDIAEIGAAAPALLVAARNGYRQAGAILLKGAEFTLSQRSTDDGRFLKNSACHDQDVLNGNIYAAVTLACSLELCPNTEYQDAVESVVEHSISRLGAHSEGWWSYSEHAGGTELVGKSLAYQATMVGYGRLLLGVLTGDLRQRWHETLQRAQDAFASVLNSQAPEQYEAPTWSRGWHRISEIALGLAPISDGEHEDGLLDAQIRVLLEARSGEVSVRDGRTATSTDLRFACNLASAVMILLTELEIDPSAGLLLQRHWAATVSPREYIDRFSDPASRPAPGRWSMVSSPDSGTMVGLPNRVETRLPENPEEWLHDDYEQQQSTLLWLHSLGFLPTMFDGHDGQEKVEKVLRGYVDFLRSAHSGPFLSRMTSLDHAVAVRIRALSTIFARYVERDTQVPDDLLWMLARDASWGSVSRNIKINNHGMMLATSVLHYEALFATGPGSATRTSVISGALRQIIEASFDSVGVCRENTPSYQAFYLRFYGELKTFLRWTAPESPLVALLEDIVTRGGETLSIMVWPEGILPPIGDSGAEKSSVVSTDGRVFSPESGLYVDKRDGTYVSLRCGHSSIVHKHADDTSLTLRVDGVELLMDGGMHNYDWKDPATVAVKSQRGHSGLFFERFDQLYPATLFRPGSTRVTSHMSMLDAAPGTVAIHCGYSIDGEFFAQRFVTFEDGHIALSDRFWSSTGEKPVQRFLVPADAVVSEDENGLVVTKDAAWMQMRFDRRRPVSRYTGERVPSLRGWISRSWGTLEECHVIEIGALTDARAMDIELSYGATEQ